MHIVNWNSDKYKSVTEALKHPDGLAVLGVLFEISTRDNPVLEPIIKATKQVRDPGKEDNIYYFTKDTNTKLSKSNYIHHNHIKFLEKVRSFESNQTNI